MLTRQRLLCLTHVPMLWIDHTFREPAANLACDEALLDLCESGSADELLRFWESPVPFVVVGYGNKVESEVDTVACRAGNIPILRRCTGGGTVLQGPGCLNYSLVLKIDRHVALENITSTNCHVMKRNAAAVSRLFGKAVLVQGHTDLALGERKFSGNAQRRKRSHLLFHGTFLLDFDLAFITRYLRQPSREPNYRGARSHDDFLMRLPLTSDQVKSALREEWQADRQLERLPDEPLRTLMATRYSHPEWHLKF
jgi:lipoate---protein ligase